LGPAPTEGAAVRRKLTSGVGDVDTTASINVVVRITKPWICLRTAAPRTRPTAKSRWGIETRVFRQNFTKPCSLQIDPVRFGRRVVLSISSPRFEPAKFQETYAAC